MPPAPRRAKRARGAAAYAPPVVPPPTAFALSVDLDFFSVRNPALRALPFSDTPGFRRDLIALAKRVPMEAGMGFITALEALVAGTDSPLDALPVVAHAAGITPNPRSGDGAQLLALLASAEVRFNEAVRSLGTLRAVLDTLLLAGLAEHEATHEELEALEGGLRAVAAALVGSGQLALPIVVARSEMYTPRRQLADIVARALRALDL